jgi:Na+-driven multidrug efflux pump
MTSYQLVRCIGGGVGRAGTAISSNLIGASRTSEIELVAKSGLLLHGIVFLVLGAISTFFLHSYCSLLIPQFPTLSSSLQHAITIALFLNIGVMYMDALYNLFEGFLRAMKDALFLSTFPTASIWLLTIVPMWFYLKKAMPPEFVYVIVLFECCLISAAFSYRFKMKLRQLPQESF